jgi:hypothetical protein
MKNVKVNVTETKGTGFLPEMGVVDAVKTVSQQGAQYAISADGTDRILQAHQVQEV